MIAQLDLFSPRSTRPDPTDPEVERLLAMGFRRVEVISLSAWIERRLPRGLDDHAPGRRPARARRDDATSSHDAADAAEANGTIEAQMRILLAAVERWPGRTTRELAELEPRIERVAAGRRATDLADRGLIERYLRRERGAQLRLWITGAHVPADAGERVQRRERAS